MDVSRTLEARMDGLTVVVVLAVTSSLALTAARVALGAVLHLMTSALPSQQGQSAGV